MSEYQRRVDCEIMETWMPSARGGKTAAMAELAAETLRAGHAVTWAAPEGIYTLDPEGDIVKMSHQTNEEPGMSDFKVGDVVRVNQHGSKWDGVVGTITADRPKGVGNMTIVIQHAPEFGDIECGVCGLGKSFWPPGILSLVSRPSEVEDNNLVKSDGWVPAGTYMPLKDALPHKGMLGDGTEFTFVRYRRMNVPLGCEEKGAGIASKLPAYSRCFPSRTTQWANQGDDYELLEDAK